MSKDAELVDFEEDLDYELDMDMNIQDEDALLEEDKCDNENELVRKMSMTTVTAIELTDAPVTTSEPTSLLHSTSIPSDFWNKSISTFANVMQSRPINKINEVVAPQDTLDKNTESNQIQEPVSEQSHADVHHEERKDATETETLQAVSIESNDSNSFDSVETGQSDKLTVTSSSSSTSTSSSSKNTQSKRSRNKNKKRKFLRRNALLNGLAHAKYHSMAIPSLMSVNTTMAFPRTKFPMMIPISVPAKTPQKKVPFIIQSNGNASRKVSLNPDFDGFTTRNIANLIEQSNRKTREPGNPNNRRITFRTVNNVDLNSVVINKRRSTTSLETISKSDVKPMDVTPIELPKPIVTAGMSDEEYLMAIAEQKKKREEVLRKKEWKRSDDEGWAFLE